MELEPGVTFSVQTVDLHDEAKAEIAAAVEAGMDPRQIAASHRKLALLIEYYLNHDTKGETR